MTPLTATNAASPPIHRSPLSVLRTLRGFSSQVCSNSRCTARREAQHRDHEEEEADEAEARARARGRREHRLDRFGAAAGQLVARR